MSVVGTALNAPESAVVLARQNPLDLQGQATSPPAQQPKPLDRVPLAIRHPETPEPGFPHRCAPVPFDRSFTTHHKEIDCTILQPSSVALTPPTMGRAKSIQPVPTHPQNPGERNRLQPLQP